MKAIIVDSPAPYCVLNLTDPARAYIRSEHTDIRHTFRQHEPIRVSPVGDDYDLVNAQDWLSAPGGFK